MAFRMENGRGGEGQPGTVPIPKGVACVKTSNILSYEHAGEYSFGGLAKTFTPGIFVKAVEIISFPLVPEQVEKLIKYCEKSPFGHNMITKMDECVRKSWQLYPDQLEINHPWWQSGMEKLTDLIAGRLGYKGVPLQCMLYKLLVYGWGRKWFEDSQMMLPKLKSRVGVLKRHFDDDQQ